MGVTYPQGLTVGILGAKNLNALVAIDKKARARVKKKATVFVREKAYKVLKDAILVSPQWSGNFAYNWQLETKNAGNTRYSAKFKVDPWQSLKAPKQAGDKAAYNENLQQLNNGVLDQITWNMTIRLVNHAPVAELIETGQVKLRPENAIPGNAGVMAYIQSKYKFVK